MSFCRIPWKKSGGILEEIARGEIYNGISGEVTGKVCEVISEEVSWRVPVITARGN